MITVNDYKDYLSVRGRNLSEVRKYHSAMIMNDTFTGDPGYKRVYILDKDTGWHYTDAKYSKHTTPSILRDEVDWYLQFRPYEHHTVGSYVFIPDDTSSDIGFLEEEPADPFSDPGFDLSKLWMIVGRNDAVEFVRYNILKCNWKFEWIARYEGKKEVLHVYGMNRVRQSYTSGRWLSDYTAQLDSTNAFWIPDTYHIYGDKIAEYGLSDTRYMALDQRVMLTLNKIHPQVFLISKIEDLDPQGVIKVTCKLDEYDTKRDSVEHMLCDYYDGSGDMQIESTDEDPTVSYWANFIVWNKINDDGELEPYSTEMHDTIKLGETYYFTIDNEQWNEDELHWYIYYRGNDADSLSEEQKNYFCDLLILTKFDETTVSIRVSKAKSLVGRMLRLCVNGKEDMHKSAVDLEVVE